MPRIAEDLRGKKFHSLTVLKRSDNGSRGQVRWLCRCDCGKQTIVDAADLKKKDYRKAVKSCGCMVSKDLTGKRYGKLVVIQRLDARNKNGVVMYECKCDCGVMKITSSTNLTTGSTTSCGCKKHENLKKAINALERVDGTCVSIIKSKKARCDSGTGIRGVHHYKANGKYTAHITFKQKHYHLGYYNTIEEAMKVRKIAEEKIYGEFLEWYEIELKKGMK